mmetsp:Transcript_44362/g.128356  ORF Transcript_44362/g.128356 Transcript_44362/m.128356 type:complete len:280 (+) Transcript_44362:1324-2163(+)
MEVAPASPPPEAMMPTNSTRSHAGLPCGISPSLYFTAMSLVRFIISRTIQPFSRPKVVAKSSPRSRRSLSEVHEGQPPICSFFSARASCCSAMDPRTVPRCGSLFAAEMRTHPSTCPEVSMPKVRSTTGRSKSTFAPLAHTSQDIPKAKCSEADESPTCTLPSAPHTNEYVVVRSPRVNLAKARSFFPTGRWRRPSVGCLASSTKTPASQAAGPLPWTRLQAPVTSTWHGSFGKSCGTITATMTTTALNGSPQQHNTALIPHIARGCKAFLESMGFDRS